MPAQPRVVPRALEPGDRVAVVAPSAPVPAERLAGGVALLRSWGLDVVVGRHVGRTAHEGMLAGTDDERAADLQEAWTDPSISAVCCARGGYGAGRLLAHLDWEALAQATPKTLLGSSDVTALHEAWARRLGVATVFGPMPATELLGEQPPQPESAAALHAMLFDGEPAVLPTTDVISPPTAAHTQIAAPLVGGTISLLAASLGTEFSVSADGAIVFLEDVGEVPYRIDRLLTQLRTAGWFAGARAVVVGSLFECGDPAVLRAVMADRLGDLGVPVLAGLEVGHGAVQRSLLLGGLARLDPLAGTLTVSGLDPDRKFPSDHAKK